MKSAEESQLDEQMNVEVYSYIKEFAYQKLNSEQERENQITEQSRTIQTVFSILSVALFSLLPVLLDGFKAKANCISVLLITAYVTVFSFLLASFVLASYIQVRKPKAGLPGIRQIKEQILANFVDLTKESAQLNSIIDTLIPIQEELTAQNNKNVRLLNWSMKMIFAAVFFIVLFSALIFEFIFLL